MNSKFEYILRLADNALILSQRLSEWCGKGPAPEEDVALANIALDLIGQARLWLAYACELDGRQRNEDQLAYLRDTREFRNVLLVEQANGTYADTLVRQFYFDAWHYLLLKGLCDSRDARIAEIAEKSIKEVGYHLQRSSDLIIRLGDGTHKSHELTQNALEDLWMYCGDLFTSDDVDLDMIEQGLAPRLEDLYPSWLQYTKDVLDEATLARPSEGTWMQTGGKRGIHTESLGYLLAEMQFLQRAYPGAQW
jgi:ring-1,2-phenylacetyl-CoA epoxidase subunit PaaC